MRFAGGSEDAEEVEAWETVGTVFSCPEVDGCSSGMEDFWTVVVYGQS